MSFIHRLIGIYKASFSGLSAYVWKLALMMFINRIGTLILPFLTLYTTQELDWSPTQGGFAASAFGLGSLAGAFLGGKLTDELGYFRTLKFGLIISAVLFFITQYFSSFYIFCGLLFVGSMAADTIRPALYSGLSYITDENTRTRSISLLRMSFNLGIAVGPAIAGILVVYIGYRSIFIIDAFTCLLAAIYLIRWMSNHQKDTEEEVAAIDSTHQSPYKDLPFMIFIVSTVIILIAFFQIVTTVPLYIKEALQYTEREVGFFFTANGLLIVLIEMPLIKYLEEKKVENFKLLIAGGTMMGVALLCLAIPVAYLIPLILYTILVSVGEIINFPYISTTAMNRATDLTRGRYMALSSMAFSIALITAPVLGTYILVGYGFDLLFISMGILNMVGIAGYFIARKLM